MKVHLTCAATCYVSLLRINLFGYFGPSVAGFNLFGDRPVFWLLMAFDKGKTETYSKIIWLDYLQFM